MRVPPVRLLCATATLLVASSSCAGAPVKLPPVPPGPDADVDVATYVLAFREGDVAYAGGHFAEAIPPLTRALAAAPRNDVLEYLLARASVQTHDDEGALHWLGRLAAEGSDLVPASARFPSLADRPGFARVVEATTRAGVRRGLLRTVVPERGLDAEGIAFDGGTGALYVGSIHRRKVLRLMPGAPAADFVRLADEGLDAPLGLRVDVPRRRLWVATAADEGQDGYTPDAARRSALVAFDLDTGARRATYPLPRDRAHLLNDIAITDAGAVYVTDSEAGLVWTLAPGATALAPVPGMTGLDYPNGIAYDRAHDALFVAEGPLVERLDRASGRCEPLAFAVGVAPAGFDGLYVDGGRLVGVVGVAAGHVVALRLDAAGRRAQAQSVLASGGVGWEAPTTAALGDGVAYVLARGEGAAGRDDTVIVTVPLGT